MPGDDIRSKLYPTLNMEEAEYIEIRSAVHGCRVTIGAFYKLHRNYNHPQLFTQGEVYVLDDDSRENYAVLLLCAATLYKL
ncbi:MULTISPECIES: hypothetical protein [unclassified Paenibacillus]|jgi:hypothetical protein|uniref:hypothetical protein n=1 Tax=unclassified Paenibacillus TaxID=185978 RepID=UPI0004F8BFCC|nr:hypothetical protein P40081_29420 [Paenibacillus sp. FSL P4-0081]OMF26358.1 hypothetical protein BK132_19110 [Paenibacillus sp. FSL H8-0259]